MKDTKIYILAGKARSGKDTAAEMIIKHYENQDRKVVLIGFSDYIKDYAKKITNWDGSDETKPRELLQVLGTDIVRKNFGENFFVNRICDDIAVYKYYFDVVVISDARFPNELDIPKERFANVKTIKVERPNFVNELSTKQKQHITEKALDDYNNYDYIIKNDGDMEDLEMKVKQMIEEVEA